MTECKSGVGRVVWGHPSKLTQKRDPQTKQLVNKADGTPYMQTAFGVAFPKAEFQQMVWPAMLAEVSTKYPGGQVPGKFAWKYVDGDGIDGEGKPYNQREGYAGCYVLTVTSNTGFAPPVYKYNPQTRTYDQVPVDAIKCGDFVVLALNFQVNVPADRMQTPSLYVNPQAVELVGYGTAIVSSGVDPMAAFGGATYQLPPGASATPMQPAPGVGMPGMPAGAPVQPQPGQMPGMVPGMPAGAPIQGMPMQPAPQPYQPQPMQPGGMPMGQLPPPAHDFVQPGGMPAPQYQPQPGQMPGMMPQQQPQPMQPGQMPGMMPGR